VSAAAPVNVAQVVAPGKDPTVVARTPTDLIKTHDTGTAGGTLASAVDPSVQRRPKTPAAHPPAAKTELDDLRTEHSRTYANPDGTYTLETSPGRMNYKDAQGTWQPVDLSLTSDP
jgi:hypothetical protein